MWQCTFYMWAVGKAWHEWLIDVTTAYIIYDAYGREVIEMFGKMHVVGVFHLKIYRVYCPFHWYTSFCSCATLCFVLQPQRQHWSIKARFVLQPQRQHWSIKARFVLQPQWQHWSIKARFVLQPQRQHWSIKARLGSHYCIHTLSKTSSFWCMIEPLEMCERRPIIKFLGVWNPPGLYGLNIWRFW